MRLEFERSDTFRPSLRRDIALLSLWGLWLLVIVSLELAYPWNFVATPLLVLYAAWAWPWWLSAFFFLFVGWVYSVFSITPAALYWVSLMIGYVIFKLAQFRFEVRSSFQFAASLVVCSAILDFSQWLLISQSLPESQWSWVLAGKLIFAAFLQGFLGYWSWPWLQRYSR